MTRQSPCAAAAALGLLLAGSAVTAHHSFAAEYDRNKPITVTGAVTKLEWTNPHARVHAVEGPGRKRQDVRCGTSSSARRTALMRNGWHRNSLKPGPQGHRDRLPVEAHGPQRQRAQRGSSRDGRQVFAGSSFDTTP